MMKRLAILLSMASLCLLPWLAQAQEMPDTLQLELDFEGTGNIILASPPEYSGDVTSGDPLVAGGTWWVEMDDSEWPGTEDPDARWNYVFAHYFEYDPYSFSWTATFDGNSLPHKPIWEINHPVNGTLGGTLVIVMTFSDWDGDGVLDLEERTFGVFSGTLMVMKYGTGLFASYCGNGAYNGALSNPDPASYADDFVEGHCLLNLIDCTIGVENVSWTTIKSLYR